MAACGGGRLRLPVMTLLLQCTYAISFGPAGGGDASYLLRSRTNPTAARRSVRPAGGGAIRGTGRAAPRRPDGPAPGGSRHALREHVRWRYARIRSGRRRAVRVHDGAGVRHLVRLGVRLLRVLHLPRGRGGVGRWCRGRCAPVADERKTTESDSLLRVIRSIALAESIQYC